MKRIKVTSKPREVHQFPFFNFTLPFFWANNVVHCMRKFGEYDLFNDHVDKRRKRTSRLAFSVLFLGSSVAWWVTIMLNPDSSVTFWVIFGVIKVAGDLWFLWDIWRKQKEFEKLKIHTEFL